MKKVVYSLMLSFMVLTASAQENSLRLGLKFGLPNVAGLGVEYVSPLASHRLAFAGDVSYIPIPFSANDFDGTFSVFYLGFGPNLYFKGDNNGKGPYFHLGAGLLTLGLDGKQSTNIMASDNVTQIPVTAEASTSISAVFVMGKLGFKWGNRFYFRPEIGYGLFSMDDAFKFTTTFTAQDPGTNQTITETKDFSVDFSIPVAGGPVFTFGFGFSF